LLAKALIDIPSQQRVVWFYSGQHHGKAAQRSKSNNRSGHRPSSHKGAGINFESQLAARLLMGAIGD
jgi:hypothetical protein